LADSLQPVDQFIDPTQTDVDNQGDILDAIPVETESEEVLEIPPLDQMPEDLTAVAHSTPLEQTVPDAPLPGWSSRGSRSKFKPTGQRFRGMQLDSRAGPVLTLMLACLVIPMAAVLAWDLGDTAGDYFGIMGMARGSRMATSQWSITFGFLSFGLVCLLFAALAISTSMIAIVTIIEWTSKTQIAWPNKAATIVASALLVALVLLFAGRLYDTIRILNTFGEQMAGRDQPGIVKQLFAVFIAFCQHAILPMAVIVLSFLRTLNR
jgi:hypothetical protein